MKGRHTYILWIPPELVTSLLGNWRYNACIAMPYFEECADMNGNRFSLPKDYDITDICYSWERRAIGLRLEHPSFPETAPGEQFPSLIYTVITVQGLPIVQDSDGTTPIIVQKVDS